MRNHQQNKVNNEFLKHKTKFYLEFFKYVYKYTISTMLRLSTIK